MLLRRVRSKRPTSDLPCLSIIVDIDNCFVRGEKTSIPYANDQRMRIFSIFLFRSFRNGDLERFPLATTRRPVDLKLTVKVGLGRVGTLYSRSSKSSVQDILTYLPSYCNNNICGEWVVYAETVTNSQLTTPLTSAVLQILGNCVHQILKRKGVRMTQQLSE